MGYAIPNLISAYARLAWPTHPGSTSLKKKFDSSTPLFVYDYVNIKKTWMTLC